jgi:hypothetical protein
VGRRAPAEAEDHLRAAAADAVASGLPADQAEHDAVTRFGAPAMMARKMRSASPRRRAPQPGIVSGLAASRPKIRGPRLGLPDRRATACA